MGEPTQRRAISRATDGKGPFKVALCTEMRGPHEAVRLREQLQDCLRRNEEAWVLNRAKFRWMPVVARYVPHFAFHLIGGHLSSRVPELALVGLQIICDENDRKPSNAIYPGKPLVKPGIYEQL